MNIKTIVDLGCGDFRIGREILSADVRYFGIDVVESLIASHQDTFGNSRTTFLHLDITRDPLPDGDVCLIRQVLQHLSNRQILKVLEKVRKYPYVIVTEHYPAVSVEGMPNRDKPPGPDTRIHQNSAVYLDLPPFNVRNLRKVLEANLKNDLMKRCETLATFLITNEGASL